MRKPTHIVHTFHVFAAAQRVLGEDTLAELWKKSPRQIYRWGTDPTVSEDANHNPLDLLLIMFDRLAEASRPDIAEAALTMAATRLGCTVTRQNIRSDKPVLVELTDVNAALGTVAACLGQRLADGEFGEKDREEAWPLAQELVRQAQELEAATRPPTR